MNIQDYEKLIQIYDEFDNIEGVVTILFGVNFAVGYDDGFFGKLQFVYDILKNNIAEKYKTDFNLNVEQRQWHQILTDKSKTAYERAYELLTE